VCCLLLSTGQAQIPVAELIKKIQEAKNDTDKVNQIVSYLNILVEGRQYDLAEKWIDSCEVLSRRANYPRGIASAKYQAGNMFFHKTEFLKADSLFSLAEIEIKKVKFTKRRIMGTIAINNSRSLIKKSLGLYDEAEKLDLANLDLARSLNDTNSIITVYANIMGSQMKRGKRKEAHLAAMDAERYAKAYNNKRLLFMLYSNLGLMESEDGNSDEAKKRYNMAIELGNNFGFDNSMLYNNLSQYYEGKEKQKILNLALSTAKRSNNDETIAMVFGNLGTICAKQGLMDSAVRSYNSAMIYFKKARMHEGICETLLNLGDIYLKKGELDKAITYYTDAEELSITHTLVNYELRSKEALSKAFQSKGDNKNGLLMLQKYMQLSDSVNNREVEKQINLLKTKTALESQRTELNAIAKAKQERIKQKAEDDKKRRELLIYIALIGFVVMCAFSFVISRSLSQNKKANRVISDQKSLLEEKQKEILDSINYAKRIQYTLLAHDHVLKKNLSEYFVLFNPKDIVSGDFYWAAKIKDRFYLAVCDCTGHGVPGAFMSLLSISSINEAIKERGLIEPNIIFDHVRDQLIESISKDGQKDGFDGILLCLKDGSNRITYAAANNAPVLVRNNTIMELGKDRMPVGIGELSSSFKSFEIEVQKGDQLYLYTDGFADQFGGPKGKKFKYKQLNDQILANSIISPEQQMNNMKTIFDTWKGTLEQVDDVCVIGIRF
jgi:serine phosphatase RsbU (regulator of sigma subunit)